VPFHGLSVVKALSMPQMGCVAARGGPLSDPLKEDVYQARCLWWGVVEEISGARWGSTDATRLG